MDILTEAQWAEWRLSPVTQAFLNYLRLKRQEIDRRKMDLMSGPAEQINPYDLSLMNGIAQACNGILVLDLKTMVEETHALEDLTKDYKKMVKESMGFDL